ncbi:pyridoxal phosphate-dependent aminotransferase [bacterium]|nr:pyridoxal phosphate-dependent aminotransferase [bacterium]
MYGIKQMLTRTVPVLVSGLAGYGVGVDNGKKAEKSRFDSVSIPTYSRQDDKSVFRFPEMNTKKMSLLIPIHRSVLDCFRSLKVSSASELVSQTSTLSALANESQCSPIRSAIGAFKVRPDANDVSAQVLCIGNLDVPTFLKEGLASVGQTTTNIPYSPTAGQPAAKQAMYQFLTLLGLPMKTIDAEKQILLTIGGTDAIQLSQLLTVGRGTGQKVGVFGPSYSNTKSLARQNLGLPVESLNFGQLINPETKELEFSHPPLDEVGAWVNESGIKALVVETLSNPTGRLMSPEYLSGLVDIMKDVDGWVITDEAYTGIKLNSELEPSSGLEVLENDPTAPIIVATTLSKNAAACGLRVGAMIASPDVIAKAENLASTTLGANDLGQKVLVNQMKLDPDALIKRVHEQEVVYQEMSEAFHKALSSLDTPIYTTKPDGAIYFVCQFEDSRFDSTEFSMYCAERGKVAYKDIGFPDQDGKAYGTVLSAGMAGFYGGESDSPGVKQIRLSMIPGTDMALTAKMLDKLYQGYLTEKAA